MTWESECIKCSGYLYGTGFQQLAHRRFVIDLSPCRSRVILCKPYHSVHARSNYTSQIIICMPNHVHSRSFRLYNYLSDTCAGCQSLFSLPVWFLLLIAHAGCQSDFTFHVHLPFAGCPSLFPLQVWFLQLIAHAGRQVRLTSHVPLPFMFCRTSSLLCGIQVGRSLCHVATTTLWNCGQMMEMSGCAPKR